MPQASPISRCVLMSGVTCDRRSDIILVHPLHPKHIRALWPPSGLHAGKSIIRGTKDKSSLGYPQLGLFKAKCIFFFNSTSSPCS